VTEAKKTRKPGRPKLPKGNAKAGYLRVRLTASELRAIELAAKANRQSVSEWVRGKINAISQG
jgi:predicted HicB family RNase H-like nuclease